MTSRGEKITYFVIIILLAFSISLKAQDKVLVQVKTFDPNLNPLPQTQISLDGEQYFYTDEKGSAFVDIANDHLPPKTVKINDKTKEVASWNYSRGILEIIIRIKTYKTLKVYVRDQNGNLLREKRVSLKLKEVVIATTNLEGYFQIPVPIEFNPSDSRLFSVSGYTIVQQQFTGNNGTLFVESMTPIMTDRKEALQTKKEPTTIQLDELDSIRSLTQFYSVMRGIQIGDLDDDYKNKIDSKFYELVSQIRDSARFGTDEEIIGKISDSTLVRNDVLFLIDQALEEENNLQQIQSEFNEKIQVINNKLSTRGKDLDDVERDQLLAELARLEKILSDNAETFYQNQSDYQFVLNSIKINLLDIKELEEQLSQSEKERLEEQKVFRQKLITGILILVGFGLLTLLFLYLARKFNKQKNELAAANYEIQRINTNLEELVAQKTESLKKTNKELDTFLYRSSHDLKRPLTSIIGLTNIAKLTLEPESYELFDKARIVATDMDKMLQKLLMISQIQYPTDYGKIDFQLSIDNAKKEFQSMITDNKLIIKSEIEDDIDFKSYTQVINIIFLNLLENAIFFSALKKVERKEIEIKVSKENTNIIIKITDYGAGIDAKVIPKIWDMFFVGHEYSKGNGLGLYIVKKGVQSLNGEIDCQSLVHEHTEFSIRLPNVESGTPRIVSNPEVLKASESEAI